MWGQQREDINSRAQWESKKIKFAYGIHIFLCKIDLPLPKLRFYVCSNNKLQENKLALDFNFTKENMCPQVFLAKMTVAQCSHWALINSKVTFSFRYCPHPWPQFGQLVPLFLDVKIHDLKDSQKQNVWMWVGKGYIYM